MGRVLIIGSGGREHALCWRMRDEGHEVHVAPGNPGMAGDATLHPCGHRPADFDALVELAVALAVDVAVIGPEQPLVDGLADRLRAASVPTVGPSARAAKLEASKADAKAFMHEHGIPAAASQTVHDLETGLAVLARLEHPPVIKADGLAAGKGVTVCESFEQARTALRECLEDDRFGSAGRTVVIEERLRGQEVSLFVLTDGTAAAVFEPAQDHKRIGEGDTGPNTGGMGAYVPAPVFDAAVEQRCMASIVEPTLRGLRAEGRPFVGVLFVGLMIDDSRAPKVIEYNCRFGDPETQALMLGLQTPLFDVLVAAASGTLTSTRLRGMPSATVVLASAGYPASSRKGDAIVGLERAVALEGVQVFHAGVRSGRGGGFETAGGRVLAVCARAEDLEVAFQRAYAAVDVIHFDGMQVRRDIGHRVRRPLSAGM